MSLHIDLIRNIQYESGKFVGPLHELGIGSDEAAIDLIAGDLVMIAIFFTGADGTVASEERNAINDMRKALYSHVVSTIDSTETNELYQRFVGLYPDRIISADCLPLTVKLLQEYDAKHGTWFATRARDLFAEVAAAIVNVDNTRDMYETITLANFREILRSEHTI